MGLGIGLFDCARFIAGKLVIFLYVCAEANRFYRCLAFGEREESPGNIEQHAS